MVSINSQPASIHLRRLPSSSKHVDLHNFKILMRFLYSNLNSSNRRNLSFLNRGKTYNKIFKPSDFQVGKLSHKISSLV